MKKIIGFLVLAFISYNVNAQISTPAASPKAVVTQTVGLTDISVEYSRPSVKERKIFAVDGLVPFGKLWRTGANAVTKLTFSDDVTVEGKKLAAGSYALLTVPNADQWIFNFYAYDKSSWTSYREANPIISVMAKPEQISGKVESFMIAFDDLTDDSATLNILWDKTWVDLKIGVEVDERVMASIEKTLAGPTAGDYYSAATYYHNSGRDLQEALKLVQKATHVEKPRFWQVRREALILADMGKYNKAIEAANKSLELAKAAGNEDYVKMNTDSINEWVMAKKKN